MAGNGEQQNGGGTALAIKSDPRALQIKQILESPKMQQSLRAAMPKHLDPGKLIRVVLGSFQKNPKLLECNPESILYSIMQSAALGLEPDGGVLGQGYLVPFYNGKNRRMECQFIPGFRGLVKLARQSGEVADVDAQVVYERDDFKYELGLNQTLTHKRNDDVVDPGKLKYAYAVARFRDGERKFVVLNEREINAIKAKSASKTREGQIVGPWFEHEAEMWKKTAVRRLCKMLPLSVDVARKIAAENEETGTIELPDTITLPDAGSLPTLPAPTDGVDEPAGEETTQEAAEPVGDWRASPLAEHEEKIGGKAIVKCLAGGKFKTLGDVYPHVVKSDHKALGLTPDQLIKLSDHIQDVMQQAELAAAGA